MPLLKKDLDDIRRIVREELETFMDALEEFETEVAESPVSARANVHGLEVTDDDLPHNMQAAPARVVEEIPPPPPPPPQESGVATPSVAVQQLEAPVGRPFIVRNAASDQPVASSRFSKYNISLEQLTAWVLKRTGAQRLEDIPEAQLDKIFGEVDFAIARGPEFVAELMGQGAAE